MATVLTPGWVFTLFLLLALVAGSGYVYTTTLEDSTEQAYQDCLDRATRSQEPWRGRTQVMMCRSLHLGDTPPVAGRYDSRPATTLSVSMTRRPNFSGRRW